MKKPEKSPQGILKIALLIPMILITLGLTTGMTPQQKTVKGKVVFADTGKPATGASIVIRNSTVGTVVDTDGTFMLNVDGDQELVVSFVGYSTLVVKSSDIGKKPLQLELETINMDLESVTMEVKEESSGTISIKQKDGSDAQPVFLLDGNVVEEIDNLNPDLIESISVIKDQNDPLVKKHNAKDGLIIITSKEGKPVYIVDGQQVDGIDNINSDHIEKMEVIKDQDHPLAKQYNAKNGLIVITSKEGTELLSPKEAKDNVIESSEKDAPVFYVVEDMPQFPGGKPALKTYIYSNLEYPEKAKSQNIEGDVVVQYVIDTDGKPQNIKILRSSYQGFDAPAMKVIREMPDWNPGKQRGKAVNVQFAVTIKFPAPSE